MQVEFNFQLVGAIHPRVWSFGEACHECEHGHVCYKRKNLIKAAVLTKITIECNDFAKAVDPQLLKIDE